MIRGRACALGLLLASLLGASGCAYSLVSDGQLRPAPFEQIVARTARARGIAPETAARTRVLATAELPAILHEALAADWSGAQIQNYQEGLTTLGLWPAELDLADAFIRVYSEEIRGLYLPTHRTLYLLDDGAPPWSLRLRSAFAHRDLPNEMIVAHELVHFLQHQAFAELMDPDPFWKSQSDAASAVQAALEGDALNYGFAALELEPPAAAALAANLDDADASLPHAALAEAPALLRLTLEFPYAYGHGLSLEEGNALLTHPPASTEQVLHPDKRHEPFQAIDLAQARAALPAECELVFEDTLGELHIAVLFRDLDGPGRSAAWEGWDGDRWLAARCGERREFVWLTAWDSESDAAEFAAAYQRIAPRVAERAGMTTPPVARVVGHEAWIASAGLVPLGERLATLALRTRVADLPGLRAHALASR